MSNEKLLEFIRKNVVSVVCVGLSLVVAAILYMRWDIAPAQDQVLEQKSTEANRLAANIVNSEELQKQYEALVAANRAISDRVIHASQLAENLQYFYRLESDTHAHLNNLLEVSPLPKPVPSPSGFIPVAFNVNVEGDYRTVLDFLRKLEHGDHYVRILNAALHPAGEGQRGDTINLALNIQVLGVP